MKMTFKLLILWPVMQVVMTQSNPQLPGRDYCIIGAGPAGLQLGYFFHQSARDYMIFERAGTPGHFFTIFPRHRKLISINKRHTGQLNKEFSFRHDWNSLISHVDTLLLTQYSKEIFPSADVLVQYLKDFQRKLGIKVQFNTEVNNIERISRNGKAMYTFQDQFNTTYYCRTVVVATGMFKPNVPSILGIDKALGYESFSTSPELYENKSVLILGVGNSAMETAESLYSHTQYVHLISRHQNLNLAWSTHYVGDLRAVNNNLLDTFLLKSLDGISHMDMKHASIQERNGKYFVILNEHYLSNRPNDYITPDNFALRKGYDVVIRCLGFTFDSSIFRQPHISRAQDKAWKYPAIHHNYESVDYPGLFVAGTASHSLDFKRSAGGFIHGFRYTTRALHRLLEWRYHNVTWPSSDVTFHQLLNIIVKRLNEASGIYQMFGVLADVVIINRATETAKYIEEFPMKLIHHLYSYTGHNASEIIVVYLDYGTLFDESNIFESVASRAHLSYFLHPILYYFRQLPSELDFKQMGSYDRLPRPDSLHHVVEDFLVLWQSINEHIRPLRRWLEQVLGKNLRHYFSGECFLRTFTHSHSPPTCNTSYLQGKGLVQSSHNPNMVAARRVLMASLI